MLRTGDYQFRDGRRARPRTKPNKLREWLEDPDCPVRKRRFAERIGCSPGYLSQLVCDEPCWPGRDIARNIGIVTKGAVTPNDLAGYEPD